MTTQPPSISPDDDITAFIRHILKERKRKINEHSNAFIKRMRDDYSKYFTGTDTEKDEISSAYAIGAIGVDDKLNPEQIDALHIKAEQYADDVIELNKQFDEKISKMERE